MARWKRCHDCGERCEVHNSRAGLCMQCWDVSPENPANEEIPDLWERAAEFRECNLQYAGEDPGGPWTNEKQEWGTTWLAGSRSTRDNDFFTAVYAVRAVRMARSGYEICGGGWRRLKSRHSTGG